MWIAWDTVCPHWMFLSFSSQKTQDAFQHSCLVTLHPLPKEVGKERMWLWCFRRVNGGRESGSDLPLITQGRHFHYNCHPVTQPTPNSGRRYAANATHDLGAAWCQYYCFWPLIPHKWTSQWQRPVTTNKLRGFSLVSFPCFILLKNNASPSQILVFWVVPWVSSLSAHGAQPSQSSQQPS